MEVKDLTKIVVEHFTEPGKGMLINPITLTLIQAACTITAKFEQQESEITNLKARIETLENENNNLKKQVYCISNETAQQWVDITPPQIRKSYKIKTEQYYSNIF
jgi:outer membrane murein-binding lipoprotein Lpp